MAPQVMIFIVDVIIKEQQYVYIKMIKIIFLEDTIQFHGMKMINGLKMMILLYLL